VSIFQFSLWLFISFHYFILFFINKIAGDSTYPTYLKNPTTIDNGLTAAGATRLVDLGKADAHQIGEKAQDKVIAEFVENLWLPLAKALSDGDDDVDVKAMQEKTIPILMEIDPDYSPPKSQRSSNDGNISFVYLALGVLIAITAALVGTGVLKLL
jgi:sulfite reductase alpha subunit-like flavoprotein